MGADDIESGNKGPRVQETSSTSTMSNKHEQITALSAKPQGNPKWAFWRASKDPFNGKRYFSSGYWYRRPNREYIEKEFQGFPIANDQPKHRHRDIYGRVTEEQRDVLQYISPTESHPKPLMVQATKEVMKTQPAGDWRRVKLDGHVPFVLKISEWALETQQLLYQVLQDHPCRAPHLAFPFLTLG
ncbi:MAG: hypothetical protein Q9183_002644 [Haloplaca sp. 2 TL-2023]